MSIPVLNYSPSSQNQRVEGYEVPSEDTPVMYRLTDAIDETDIQEIIWAIYRQIFSEHLILEKYRQPHLESQLRNRMIDVRDFVRGLGKTDVYREEVAENNSNYRLVDISFKRFLGRASYGQDERIAWSIIIATKGLHGFIDAIVDSQEYRENFGNDIVPFQRRRYKGRPFNLVNPRYNEDFRSRLMMRNYGGSSYYTARTSGEYASKQDIRKQIPSNFMSMAGGIMTNERNYQRTIASVTSQVRNMEIPDMTRDSSTPPTVKPTEVALPYRYVPSRKTT